MGLILQGISVLKELYDTNKTSKEEISDKLLYKGVYNTVQTKIRDYQRDYEDLVIKSVFNREDEVGKSIQQLLVFIYNKESILSVLQGVQNNSFTLFSNESEKEFEEEFLLDTAILDELFTVSFSYFFKDYIIQNQDESILKYKETLERLELSIHTYMTEYSAETQIEDLAILLNLLEVHGYIDKIHREYRVSAETILLEAWEDLYQKYVDGQEIVDGFIVPGGAILADGEDRKYAGVLNISSNKVVVEPNTISNPLYEEFIASCADAGVNLVKTVSDNADSITPYQYNPLLQKMVASGNINKTAFQQGWKKYKEVLRKQFERKTKELAVKREQGTDEIFYQELSGYMISLMVMNYKQGLGMQLRFCVGDTSKTETVARIFVNRLRRREQTHNSIAQGKLVVGDYILSASKKTATVSIYQNMQGYQAVPQFMGELLCNLREGMFKPSLKNMIIGVDLNNDIVTAPFTKWLLPIIAGSRSGKGVLTLNMLLNVIGVGAPLFYLDGKPDMAALLWNLQKKHNIPYSMVVDGVACEGKTEIGGIPYKAPYADTVVKMLQRPNTIPLLESNMHLMVYIKTMQVFLLAFTYYKQVMDSPYGDIFVVFDEVYKVMKASLQNFITKLDAEIKSCSKENKDYKEDLSLIRIWIASILLEMTSNDIGIFGGGVKAVALTQFSQDTQYNMGNFQEGKVFCSNFLIKRSVKLFGRQEGGTGTYGVKRDTNDTETFDLYDKYYHFGIGTETENTYKTLKTFKPLLVLNDNDCKELTGKDTDGAFIGGVIDRIGSYVDVESFRTRYFRENEELARAIGFEGALDQVARLLGGKWEEMLANSLGHAYEIADKALRYYGIIGFDGIDTVYDYICSAEVQHLWDYSTIITSKLKNVPLKPANQRGIEEKDNLNERTNVGESQVSVLRTETEYKDKDAEVDKDLLAPALNEEPIERTDIFDSKLQREPRDRSGKFVDFIEPLQQQSERVSNISRVQPRSSRLKSVQEQLEEPLKEQTLEFDVKIPPSPYQSKTKGLLGSLATNNLISEQILELITQVFGDVLNIKEVEITARGLWLNGKFFKPRFNEEFIESLPLAMQADVRQGNIIDLINYKHLLKFKNMVVLRIDDVALAEGRIRYEIGLRADQSWWDLQRKLRYLMYIYIEGVQIRDETTSKTYEIGSQKDYRITEKVREKLGIAAGVTNRSMVGKIWNSPQARIIKKASAWTAGTFVVSSLVSVMGAFGLVFGAVAGYGAYREIKKNNKDI